MQLPHTTSTADYTKAFHDTLNGVYNRQLSLWRVAISLTHSAVHV